MSENVNLIRALDERLQRLDDVELERLCLLHFPSVYGKFGRGQRRDEKILILLEYCYRNPEAAVSLAALLGMPVAESPLLSGRGPVSPRLAPLPPGPIRNRWALLVGVDRYIDPAIAPLKYCTADVLALQRMLENLGYTVVALHDAVGGEHLDPTRDNIEAELLRLCQAAGPEDLIWVHFSCHGRLVEGRPVLLSREVRLPTLAKKALPLAEVESVLRRSPARRRVLTLDACHTGVRVGRELADPEFIRNVYERAEGFALLAASTSQQIAQAWEEKEHGVFTYFLLEGLCGKADQSGKGFVTVNDLALYVLDQLRRWIVQHSGAIQEPTARVEGLGDIILADYR